MSVHRDERGFLVITFVLNLRLDVVDGVGGLSLQRDLECALETKSLRHVPGPHAHGLLGVSISETGASKVTAPPEICSGLIPECTVGLYS